LKQSVEGVGWNVVVLHPLSEQIYQHAFLQDPWAVSDIDIGGGVQGRKLLLFCWRQGDFTHIQSVFVQSRAE
jgi:hypothetical protein